MLMTSSSWMPLAPRVSPTIWPHESFSKACAVDHRAGDCTRQRLESRLNPLYDSMVRTYQEVFDELYILDVRDAGNKILIALPRSCESRVRSSRDGPGRSRGRSSSGCTWQIW